MRFELPPDKHAMSNEQLLDDLRNCASKVAPQALSKDRYNEIGLFSAAGIQRRFGSWNLALSQAELSRIKRVGIPREELFADLRRVARDLGKNTVTRLEYSSRGRFSSAPLCRQFDGSWSDALRAAGLQESRLANFNGGDEEYFEVIEAAWQKIGRPPKQAEIRRPEYPVGATSIVRHFGSWRRALERFVEQAESDRNDVNIIGETAVASVPANDAKVSIHRTQRNISWRLRFLVLRRDGFRCRLCGASPAITPGVQLQVDHIEPWAVGGQTVLENLQSTCDRCNGGKSALPLSEPQERSTTGGVR
jgi:5-methylcytosine-specific restriction endonuclease McrA